MKNYKGTDRWMKCFGFKFELGVKYSIPNNEDLEMCYNGFHSCDKLIQVTKFYPVSDSRYFEVEIESTLVSSEKNCSRHITLIRELTFNEVMHLLNFKNDKSELSPEDNQTNTGFFNTGNYNSGNYNTGNYNSGNENKKSV